MLKSPSIAGLKIGSQSMQPPIRSALLCVALPLLRCPARAHDCETMLNNKCLYLISLAVDSHSRYPPIRWWCKKPWFSDCLSNVHSLRNWPSRVDIKGVSLNIFLLLTNKHFLLFVHVLSKHISS
uniref:Uncharacterized protein n=1 Tax=Arundo donax TaxID=35708 RepID=A0A0A9I0P4_ARUDO